MTEQHLFLLRVLAAKIDAAGERSFGIHDPGRRELVRHGYLLALAELERTFSEQTADERHVALDAH